MRGRFKYVCDECGEHTWLTNRDRERSAACRCSYCGSLRINPTKKSTASQKISATRMAARESKDLNRQKQNMT